MSLSREICARANSPSADYDPEADGRDIESDSGSEASSVQNAGTEHYESVGKSKLRQKESATLGPQYRGSKVSRAALEQGSEDGEEEDEDDEGLSGDDEYDDPETADLEADGARADDSDIDSENALAASDAEHLAGFTFRGSSKPARGRKQRATAADFMSSSGEEDVEYGINGEDGVEESEEDEDMDDGLDGLLNGEDDSEEDEEDSDEDDGDDDAEEEDEEEDGSESESDDEKETAAPRPSTLAPGVDADVQKGLAIQQQRQIYDVLLNLRIRLQKALVASNTFSALDESSSESEPYEAAEGAAVKLLNTIGDLKMDLASSRAGNKRKREIEVSTPSEDIWEQIQEEDRKLSRPRKEKLEKWSQKVRAVNDAPGKKSLTHSLAERLAETEHRLVKRTKVPRSCAPAQAAKRIGEDDNIYDDADFYQQLLKELVEQRTVDSNTEQASAVPSVMLTAAKDSKMRKNVDRKASKGRKMRFTVHEKLQNFMASEDRRSWEQGAIDRLFGTLFGQKLELDEGEESEDEDMDGLAADTEGVRLFA